MRARLQTLFYYGLFKPLYDIKTDIKGIFVYSTKVRFYEEVMSVHVHEHTHKHKVKPIDDISFVIAKNHIFPQPKAAVNVSPYYPNIKYVSSPC